MGGPGSGDRTKLEKVKDTIAIIRGAAPDAAAYLRDIITGKVKRPSWARIRCCEFIIEHEIGKPRQKTELTGAGGIPLDWRALVLLAEKREGGRDEPDSPPLLAEQATKPIEEPKEELGVLFCACGAEFKTEGALRHHQAVCPGSKVEDAVSG